MKKIAGITGLLILFCIGGCALVQKEATFLKASNRFHFPGEDMEESLIVRFKKEGGDGVRVTGIADYKADTVVDPRYVIDEETPMEDEDFYAYGIQLPMFKGMKVSFSKITYQKDQEDKTADIGIYEIEKNGIGIEEASISKNWDSEEKELYIDVYTKETGRLIHVEAVNPDVPVKIEIQRNKYGDFDTDTRVILRYELPKEYDMTATNFCYTFEKNGRRIQRYGRGVVELYRNGNPTAGRGFQRLAV